MLAAGEGKRLRPLTQLRPKPLCPVGGEVLLDRALARVARGAARVAVNAHHLSSQIADHVGVHWPDVHLSIEGPAALGTAGAIGQLRSWIDAAPVLVANGDAWHDEDPVPALLDGWDGERPRLLVVEDHDRADFGPYRFAGLSLLPAQDAARLPAEPLGLYEAVWRDRHAAGELDLVELGGAFVDCGSPADYLQANLFASGGASVIGEGARVDGEVVRSVVWPGAHVAADEVLVDAIRATGGVTVQVGCR